MLSVEAKVARIVPPRFVGRTLVTFRAVTPSQAAAHSAAVEMVSGAIRNLVLVGPTGLGKTHLAAAVVAAILDRDEYAFSRAVEGAGMDTAPRLYPKPLWLNVADACSSMRFEIDAPPDDRDVTLKVRQARTHPGLVVLDDLGREKTSDWTGELIYALVNARYEAMLPTLVTSNLTPAELAASTYWTSISRLAEDGRLVKVEGDDHRLSADRQLRERETRDE